MAECELIDLSDYGLEKVAGFIDGKVAFIIDSLVVMFPAEQLEIECF